MAAGRRLFFLLSWFSQQFSRFFCAVMGVVLLALASTVALAKKPVLELEAPKSVVQLLRQYVYILKNDAVAIPEEGPDRRTRLRRTRHEVQDLLATEGYFAPEVEVNPTDDGRWKLVVKPGKRAKVVAVGIYFADEGTDAEEARREKIRVDWTMPVGENFRQSSWEAAKQKLLDALRNERYAGARFVSTRADIDPDNAWARLKVVIDAGPAYHFGKLKVSGIETLPPDFVGRFNSIREGSIFRRSELLKLQETLQAAPQFSSVMVSVDPEMADPKSMDINVRVRQAARRRLGFGVGYSTNTGYRFDTSYRDVNLFRKGWELSSGLRVEQRRQAIFSDIFLPPHDARYRDSFGIGLERSHIENLLIETEAIGVARSRKHDDIETGTVIRLQHEETRPDHLDRSRYDTTTINWTWVQRKVDDVLNPRKGRVTEFQLGGGVGISVEANNFGRLYTRHQHYFSLSPKDVLMLRAEGGATIAPSREGIPQDFLFRAGGTNSIRGFAYRSIGMDEGSATVGGRYLLAGSAEWVHWVKPDKGLALFMDSGDVADSANTFENNFGYGLGGRLQTPAGPIAVDLAWAHREKRPRLHFGVAIAF